MSEWYPNLSEQPHEVREAHRVAYRALYTLRGRLDELAATAATKQQLAALTAPSAVRDALQAGGVAPLNVTNLLGVLASSQSAVLRDTHANRLALYPAVGQAAGTQFWEEDRRVLYLLDVVSGANAWLYVAGIMTDLLAARPVDLGTSDVGFRFYASDAGTGYRWTGTAWVTTPELGVVVLGTHAQRLTATFGSWRYAAGAEFYETDRTTIYLAENASGTVNTNGTTVTWVGGDQFKAYQVGAAITVNAVATTVTAFTSATQISVADTLGVHAAVAYTMASGKWVWGAGCWFDVYANRPTSATGFGVDDIGALFYATDYTHGFQWRYDDASTPTYAWTVLFGLMRGTFATRPTTLSTTDVFSDNGFLFFATDRNHAWRWNSFSSTAPATAYWDVRPEFSYAASGAIASITAGLTVHDVGYRYNATDFDREYTWGGAAWADSPSQPQRDVVHLCRTAPAGNGWHLCDGTAGVLLSKSDGTTTAITVPTLNAATFLRGNAAYSGPAATAAVPPTTVAHHHAIADQNTGTPSATTTVDNTLAGSTVAVGSATHVHDVAAQNTGDTTVVVNADGLPKLMDLIPYLRL